MRSSAQAQGHQLQPPRPKLVLRMMLCPLQRRSSGRDRWTLSIQKSTISGAECWMRGRSFETNADLGTRPKSILSGSSPRNVLGSRQGETRSKLANCRLRSRSSPRRAMYLRSSAVPRRPRGGKRRQNHRGCRATAELRHQRASSSSNADCCRSDAASHPDMWPLHLSFDTKGFSQSSSRPTLQLRLTWSTASRLWDITYWQCLFIQTYPLDGDLRSVSWAANLSILHAMILTD